MNEPSLRMRVKEIRENDPAFFEQMVNWRDEYKARRKKGSEHYWLDTKWMQRFISYNGHVTKKPFTVEDALQFLWWKWNEEDEEEYAKV